MASWAKEKALMNPTIVCDELFHDFQLEILLGSRNLNRADCNSRPDPKCEKGLLQQGVCRKGLTTIVKTKLLREK
jgi:hypothetical protein